MNQFRKPTIVVSKCLGFDSCRYDGQIIANDLVEKLKKHTNIIPVCPEVEIGLGVPRPSLRIVEKNEQLSLIQPKTKKILTDEMERFSHNFLKDKEIEGFILKNRSPSCGIKDSKLYKENNPNPIGKTSGFFTATAMDLFPNCIFEDEGRLTNYRIREHFLTSIFSLADFRKIKQAKRMAELVKFQSRYKYLFMSLNEQVMRKLGRIVANPEQISTENIFENFEKQLFKIFNKMAKYTSNINVLMHAFGYFSNVLNKQEKYFFLEVLEKYRNKKIPLSVPKNILKSWIIKYDEKYLAGQIFFNPYPEELIDIKDSGTGR